MGLGGSEGAPHCRVNNISSSWGGPVLVYLISGRRHTGDKYCTQLMRTWVRGGCRFRQASRSLWVHKIKGTTPAHREPKLKSVLARGKHIEGPVFKNGWMEQWGGCNKGAQRERVVFLRFSATKGESNKTVCQKKRRKKGGGFPLHKSRLCYWGDGYNHGNQFVWKRTAIKQYGGILKKPKG